jgi:hypothetical protein
MKLLAIAGLLVIGVSPSAIREPFKATLSSCSSYWSAAPAPQTSNAQCNALAFANENRGS